jgi:hypothetical protein
MAHKTEDKEIWKAINRIWAKGPNKKIAYEEIKILIETYVRADKELTPIQQLEQILISRLSYSDRWKSVRIETHAKHFVIIWSVPRGNNKQPFETMAILYEDLTKETERHTLKLYKERQKYNGSLN